MQSCSKRSTEGINPFTPQQLKKQHLKIKITTEQNIPRCYIFTDFKYNGYRQIVQSKKYIYNNPTQETMTKMISLSIYVIFEDVVWEVF